jgi:hypothetical protein
MIARRGDIITVNQVIVPTTGPGTIAHQLHPNTLALVKKCPVNVSYCIVRFYDIYGDSQEASVMFDSIANVWSPRWRKLK